MAVTFLYIPKLSFEFKSTSLFPSSFPALMNALPTSDISGVDTFVGPLVP